MTMATDSIETDEGSSQPWDGKLPAALSSAEKDRRDAERYRWIRAAALAPDQSELLEALESIDPEPADEAAFDAAIDAARAFVEKGTSA